MTSKRAKRYSEQKRRLKRRVFFRDGFTCQECGYKPEDLPGRHWSGEGLVGTLSRNRLKAIREGSAKDDVDIYQHPKYFIQFLTLDHVFEDALGGPMTYHNLQTLCNSCNSRKSNHISLIITKHKRAGESDDDAPILAAIELGVDVCSVNWRGVYHKCCDTAHKNGLDFISPGAVSSAHTEEQVTGGHHGPQHDARDLPDVGDQPSQRRALRWWTALLHRASHPRRDEPRHSA